MTNELKPGTYITEFVAGGPKNYAFKVNNGGEIVKIRGFHLDAATSEQLDMNTMKNLVKAFVKDKVVETVSIFRAKIARTKDHNVVTMIEKKYYRIAYDKHVMLSDFTTVPYGY